MAERRLQAIREVAGSMPNTYEPSYLDRLREHCDAGWRLLGKTISVL